MSVIKKSDVKNHLSIRNRNGIHLHRPASQPDATGFSGEESGRKDENLDHSVEESLKQPLSTGLETPPILIESGSGNIVTPVVSKSAQA
jgi:hypothetical protein